MMMWSAGSEKFSKNSGKRHRNGLWEILMT
jgi:hypothetical protein